jgi:hypothetical protein
MRVDLCDGVGIEAQRDGQLTDGRELVAGLEAARGDGDADAAFELRVERRRIARVDGAGPVHGRAHLDAIVLVH